MIDFGIDKLALIGVVALVVIGPEKLPRVARTVGNLMGRAQRYMADVKAEVNRSMELDQLRQMREDVETAAAQARDQFQGEVRSAESSWNEAVNGPTPSPSSPLAEVSGGGFDAGASSSASGLPGSSGSSSWSTPIEGASYPANDPSASSAYDGVYSSGLYPLPARKSKATWRARRAAVPAWYKQRHHLRSQAQNAAARVSRFRPASKSMHG